MTEKDVASWYQHIIAASKQSTSAGFETFMDFYQEMRGPSEPMTNPLRAYVKHKKDCDVVTEPHPRYNPCTCGLEAALAAEPPPADYVTELMKDIPAKEDGSDRG